MEQLTLFSPVTALRGVKSARAAQLEKLNIRTLYDLISYFPRTYEDRTKICNIGSLQTGVAACFEAMVVSSPNTAHIRKGLDITRVTVADVTGKLTLIYFNQPYLSRQLQYGASYRFYGILQEEPSRQMANPAFEPLDTAGAVTGRLFPVYSLTAGVSNSLMQKSVRQALDACIDTIPEILPEEVRRRYHLCGVRFAYEAIHAPRDMQSLESARRRLIFEEFFIFAAGLNRLRQQQSRCACTPMDVTMMDEFYCALPFSLTRAQQRAVDEVLHDLSSGHAMNRMVQGDVGSGKTIVAAAAAYCAIKNGHQAALLAPTEILAEQHAKSLGHLFDALRVPSVLLTGSLTAAQKRAVKEQLASGEAQLIIGTHALFSGDVVFHDLGLVIADEQHRFGVAQRAALAAKGTQPHLLVMSATPIPRTLALIAYGDLDLSVIDELPPGRQKIDTFLVGEPLRRRVHAFIRKQCQDGGQAYIVCPAVEDTEDTSLKSAELWAQTLQMAIFPDLRVGLLHGKMKPAEKESVMGAFARHALDILVSTTVIEVGVDVPNANVMVVENAERFGLSQLHQLRGRVGRGQRKSYCILFTDSRAPDTLTRLRTLTQTNDGFQIAEQDLALRGPGDFFGSRQHGIPLFRVASLQMDMDTLRQAQEAANDALSDESWTWREEYTPLRARIDALFQREDIALN